MLSHCFKKSTCTQCSLNSGRLQKWLGVNIIISARRQGIRKFVWNNSDIKNVARNFYFWSKSVSVNCIHSYFFRLAPKSSFWARSATVSAKCDRTVLPHQTRKPCKWLWESLLLFKWVCCLALINFLVGSFYVDNGRGWADKKWWHKTKRFKM